jgi:hypothetical protein
VSPVGWFQVAVEQRAEHTHRPQGREERPAEALPAIGVISAPASRAGAPARSSTRVPRRSAPLGRLALAVNAVLDFPFSNPTRADEARCVAAVRTQAR